MDWSKKAIAQLKAELIRRRLGRTAMMHNLAQRLKAMDTFPRTPTGRQGVYEKELERYREEALERVVPFEPFSRLPKELRAYIWDPSLPGPRVLSMGIAEWEGKEVAYFPKGPSAPNPVLLFVNREAREVALRYTLSFGSSQVFVDLAGGDALYFDLEYLPREMNVREFWRG